MNEAPITKENIDVLIHKLRNGEIGVFEEIYALYYLPIYRYIKRRVSNSEDASDLVQSVFMKIWGNMNKENKDLKNTKTLFYTIAKNTLIDFYRKKSNNEIVSDELVYENIIDMNYEEIDEDDENKKKLLKYIKELSKGEQEIIDLYYNQDLSYKEIHEITGKKEDAIRQTHSRALKKLKSLFI